MTDIATLFAKDPMEYTKEDLGEIVQKFRDSWKQYNLGNVKAGSTKPKTAKEKQTEALASVLKLDIKL